MDKATMDKPTPEFNYELCMACGVCTQACPFNCLSLDKADIGKYKTKQYPLLVNVQDCTSCKICQKDCPVDAVMM